MIKSRKRWGKEQLNESEVKSAVVVGGAPDCSSLSRRWNGNFFKKHVFFNFTLSTLSELVFEGMGEWVDMCLQSGY